MAKKLKTDMMMEVQIGKYGTIHISHKTGLGNVQDVIDMANTSARMKGDKGDYTIQKAMQSQDLWKYIFEVQVLEFNSDPSKVIGYNPSKMIEDSNSHESCDNSRDLFSGLGDLSKPKIYNVVADYSIIEENTDKYGHVYYSKLMKLFPDLIQSRRGKYGGTWANLQILLKIAGNIDKAVEALAYKMLSDGLFQARDDGGVAFKKLNALMDKKLTDLPNKPFRYTQIANAVRTKLEIKDTKGFNDKEHVEMVQKERTKLLDMCVKMIDMNMIRTHEELLNFIEKY